MSGLAACALNTPASSAGPTSPASTGTNAAASSSVPPLPTAAAAPGASEGNAVVPAAGQSEDTSHPDQVIGTGTPVGCTSAAVVNAVAAGGIITFNCGPKPITITMTTPAKVVNTSHQVVLDGGGKVTLSGGGQSRILYMNTCDPQQRVVTDDCWEQRWPQLVAQNIDFTDAYSATRQSTTASYGGGAIFDEGGQLKVVNAVFTGNHCYAGDPDLGGGAIRAYGMDLGVPVYITHDRFTGNSCSNGGALSGLYANYAVYDSQLTGNSAIGWGANPAKPGTPGGGSGGAIYTDGDGYNLLVDGTVISGNTAREGGGAIFYVVDAHGGVLTIDNSSLHHNPSGVFQNAPGIFESVNRVDIQPVEANSSIG